VFPLRRFYAGQVSEHASDKARVIPLVPPVQAAPLAPPQQPPPAPRRSVPDPPTAPREPLWRDVVGDVLRRERRAQQRTLQDVADAARISMPYLSELERGRKEASSEVLAAAARALALTLADLLDRAQRELHRPGAPGRGQAHGTADRAHPTAHRPVTSRLERPSAPLGSGRSGVRRRVPGSGLRLAA
jgi:transcriptional regulator with XRE-family HTH domain